MEMEPEAKKRRLDHYQSHGGAESSSRVSQYQGHHNSSHFGGQGIQNHNGTFQIGRDYISVNVPDSLSTTHASNSRQSLLGSLRFDQIDARQLSIKKAHSNTCRWFLTTSVYKQWMNRDPLQHINQFLWIKGKPGAGKSTLMKFLLTQTRTRIRGDANAEVLISFFFNARGSDLEKSTIGLYRTTLLQLLETRPELQHVFDSVRVGHQWSVESLIFLFDEAVRSLGEISVTCFIDALDECEESQIRDMVRFFSELVGTGTRLYVCFASRHYPHITVNTGLSIVLEDQTEHENDIATYLSTALHIGHGNLAEQLRCEIQEKSLGVFMWVVLVVDILNKQYDAGAKHTLRERLRQLPSDLHDLFRELLTRDNNHTEGLLFCIQWVLFAKQPLTPRELYLAIVSGVEPEHLHDCHSDDITEDDIRKYILDNSKGLAESTKSKLPTVQFIHESVRDFLLKGDGLSQVFCDIKTNIHGESHEALKRCCMRYMSFGREVTDLFRTKPGEATSPEEVNSCLPFLAYTSRGVLFHAEQAQTGGVDQQEFLAGFHLSLWVEQYNMLEKHRKRHYKPGVSLLYVLAAADTPALIHVCPNPQSCFDVEDQRYGLPILAALMTKQSGAATALLEMEIERMPGFSLRNFCGQFPPSIKQIKALSLDFSFDVKREIFPQLIAHADETTSLIFLSMMKCDIHSEGRRGIGEMMVHAAEHGYIILLSELIDRGADINAVDWKGRNPLCEASRKGQIEVMNILIQHGADMSAADDNGQYPLHLASYGGHFDVVKVLINDGANVLARDKIGFTPLHHVSVSPKTNVEIAQFLIESGADISVRDHQEKTPLYVACEHQKYELFKLFCQHGADISLLDNGKWYSALHLVSGHKKTDIAEILIERGAFITNANRLGETPLHWVARRGSLNMARFFINHGADVSAITHQSETPLHWAFICGNVEMALLLIQCGADVSATNKNGLIPVQLLAEGLRTTFNKLLERLAPVR